MARPDTSDVAAPSTEHRQADMVATLSRNAWHGITEAEQKRRTVAAGKAHADDKAEMQERRLGRKLTFGEKLRLQYVATLAENTAATEAEQAATEASPSHVHARQNPPPQPLPGWKLREMRARPLQQRLIHEAAELQANADEFEAELFGADAEMLAQFRQNDLLVAREARRKRRAEETSQVILSGCDGVLYPAENKEDNNAHMMDVKKDDKKESYVL